MLFLIITLILLFLLINLLFYISIKKAFSKQTNQNSGQKISVVVAARNEENNIPVLIEALKNQNYDKDNYELIIVDDFSTDNTFSIANELASSSKNFTATKAETKNIDC